MDKMTEIYNGLVSKLQKVGNMSSRGIRIDVEEKLGATLDVYEAVVNNFDKLNSQEIQNLGVLRQYVQCMHDTWAVNAMFCKGRYEEDGRTG